MKRARDTDNPCLLLDTLIDDTLWCIFRACPPVTRVRLAQTCSRLAHVYHGRLPPEARTANFVARLFHDEMFASVTARDIHIILDREYECGVLRVERYLNLLYALGKMDKPDLYAVAMVHVRTFPLDTEYMYVLGAASVGALARVQAWFEQHPQCSYYDMDWDGLMQESLQSRSIPLLKWIVDNPIAMICPGPSTWPDVCAMRDMGIFECVVDRYTEHVAKYYLVKCIIKRGTPEMLAFIQTHRPHILLHSESPRVEHKIRKYLLCRTIMDRAQFMAILGMDTLHEEMRDM